MPQVSRTLPAGDYYVGDPCYCFDEAWEDLLAPVDVRSRALLETDIGDYAFTAACTAYGDGVYRDPCYAFAFGVDAGILGVVPVDKAEHVPSPGLMLRRTFDAPFTVTEDGGVITIGDIVIDTTGN